MGERINAIRKRLSNVSLGVMRGFVAFTFDDVATLLDALDERTMERDAFLRGLREGVEIAKEHVGKEPCDRHKSPPPYGTIDWERGNCLACEEYLDWTAVDAELERRTK